MLDSHSFDKICVQKFDRKENYNGMETDGMWGMRQEIQDSMWKMVSKIT